MRSPEKICYKEHTFSKCFQVPAIHCCDDCWNNKDENSYSLPEEMYGGVGV